MVVFELIEGEPRAVPAAALEARSTAGPDDITTESVLDDAQRHGPGKGSRWPALLLILAIFAVGAFAIWWSLLR